MVAERPFIVIGFSFQCREVQAACCHFIETTTHKIRMSGYQAEITRHLRPIVERCAVTAVEFLDLLEGEIFERKPRPDIERRLIQICDEQMRLGRIGDDEGESLPWPGRIERPLVMPGSEQP